MRHSGPQPGRITVETAAAPSDGELLAALSAGRALAVSRWATGDMPVRLAILARMAASIDRHAEEIAAVIARDGAVPLAKASDETRLTSAVLRYYAEHAERLLAPRETATSIGTLRIEHDRLGLVVAIAPRAFSFARCARMTGCNLAVGNPIVVHHGGPVPGAIRMLEQLCRAAGAPDGAVAHFAATKAQLLALVQDARVGGVLVAADRGGDRMVDGLRRACPGKPLIDLGRAGLFAVPDDARDVAPSDDGTDRSPAAGATGGFITAFTAPLLDHPVAYRPRRAEAPMADAVDTAPLHFHRQERNVR